MKKSFYIIIIFILNTYILNVQKVYGNTFILNAGFEENGNWSAMNSNISFSYVNDQFYEGQHSALIHNSSSTAVGIEQTITTITSNQQYEITGFVKFSSPLPTKAFLRIAWYSSPDGSGSQISIQDSSINTSSSDWTKLELYPISPPSAHSAKIRLITTSGAAYFDTIDMRMFTPSPTQTITLTDSLSPTIPSPTISQINPTATTTIIPTSSYSSNYENIVISEVMVDPIDGIEWVEIENKNNFKVEILKWYIDDEENTGGIPKEFSVSIDSGQLTVIELNSSMFNNAGDSVRLLNNNKIVKDSFEYSSSKKGISIGRSGEDYCFQESSKSLINYPCIIEQSNTPTPILTLTSNSKSKSILSSPSKAKENPNTKSKILLSSDNVENDNSDQSDAPLYFQLSTEDSAQPEGNKKNPVEITYSYKNTSSPSLLILKILALLACSFTTLAITSILIKMRRSPTLYYSWAKLSK